MCVSRKFSCRYWALPTWCILEGAGRWPPTVISKEICLKFIQSIRSCPAVPELCRAKEVHLVVSAEEQVCEEVGAAHQGPSSSSWEMQMNQPFN